jgi:hypothetical protein
MQPEIIGVFDGKYTTITIKERRVNVGVIIFRTQLNESSPVDYIGYCEPVYKDSIIKYLQKIRWDKSTREIVNEVLFEKFSRYYSVNKWTPASGFADPLDYYIHEPTKRDEMEKAIANPADSIDAALAAGVMSEKEVRAEFAEHIEPQTGERPDDAAPGECIGSPMPPRGDETPMEEAAS